MLQNIAVRAFSNGQKRHYVDEIAQIRTRHVARDLVRRQGLPIDGAVMVFVVVIVVCSGNVPCVDTEDRLATGSVGVSDVDLSIKASQNGRVQDIGAIGRSNDNNRPCIIGRRRIGKAFRID